MKKTLQLSAAALTSLVLCACGGGTDNSTSSSSTSPSTSMSMSSSMSQSSMSQSSITSSTSSSSSSSSSSPSSSSSGSSSSVEAAVLDAQSTTWFTTFCSGLGGVADAFTTMGTELSGATGTPQEKQTTVTTAVSAGATKFKELATAIGSIPPPTIDGGAEIASTAVTGFNSLGDSILAAATEFGQAPATDEAALKAAAIKLQTGLQAAATQAQTSFDSLDADSSPEMDKAITDIPECGFLKN